MNRLARCARIILSKSHKGIPPSTTTTTTTTQQATIATRTMSTSTTTEHQVVHYPDKRMFAIELEQGTALLEYVIEGAMIKIILNSKFLMDNFLQVFPCLPYIILRSLLSLIISEKIYSIHFEKC